LEAEVAAMIHRDQVLQTVGFPQGQVTVADLTAVARGESIHVNFPSLGSLRAIAAEVEELDGAMVLARSGSDDFSAEEIGLVRAMARSLSMTLRNIRMLERERSLREEGERRALENMNLLVMLQDRQAFLERLAKIQVSISRRVPLPEVFDAIVAGAHELLGDEVVAIRLVDREDPRYMNLMSSVGVSRAMLASTSRTLVSEGAGGRAVVEDRVVTIEDYEHERGTMSEFVGARLQSAMAAPVHEHGQPVGSIVVASYRLGRTYTDTEREMLLTLAHHASIALNGAKAVEQMRHLAYHDSLTGLPNRALFAEHLGRAVANAQRSGASLAVLFLDLDRFKMVNDSLGHPVGDRLLAATAQRLRVSLRAADLAARLGGDEFAVLAENTSLEGARALADVIIDALRDPFHIDGHELSLTASVGLAVDQGGSTTADGLLRNADLAMYRAKLEGAAGHLVYEPAMHAVVADRVVLEGNLRRAVALDEFAVYYQPIVLLASGDVVGVEALVRWRRDDGTLVPPMEFIPVAEEMGLIVPIGRSVMREAMRQVTAWQDSNKGKGPLSLSINLSVRQLHQADFVNEVMDAVESTGFDPEALVLEITETALMHDTSVVRSRLEALRSHGIRIALDDFGTGYSSLSYLRQFPIDTLKIDKSFVADVTEGEEHAAVTRAVIELGRSLHLEVVAEGVEEPRQVTELMRLQCRLGQGYHFSKPLSARDMTAYLRTQRVHGDVQPRRRGNLHVISRDNVLAG
jgi:diguanylate cyclase (GGDEF)-like protein